MATQPPYDQPNPAEPEPICPPGQEYRNGKCRRIQAEPRNPDKGKAGYPGDTETGGGGAVTPPAAIPQVAPIALAGMPCPPGTCRDVMSHECRWYNTNREKPNETDDPIRPGGVGGHGFCKPLSNPANMRGGGGGGVARPAGAGTGVGTAQPEFDYGFIDDLLKRIQGQQGPYDQATLDRQNALLFADSQGRIAGEKQELGRDLVHRNIARSGFAVEQAGQIERGARADYGKARSALLVRAAEENYKSKVSALQQEFQLLGLRQQAMLTTARNQLDRDIANANIQLGYARIQAEMEQLQLQLANSIKLANLGYEHDTWKTIYGSM